MMLHNVAAGMSYLHARNHIHGDMRSPNLFVGADGMVRRGCVAGGHRSANYITLHFLHNRYTCTSTAGSENRRGTATIAHAAWVDGQYSYGVQPLSVCVLRTGSTATVGEPVMPFNCVAEPQTPGLNMEGESCR